MTFLIFDDKSENYFVARRTKDQVKENFHDMAVGEVRMLSDTIGIIREASQVTAPVVDTLKAPHVTGCTR